MGEIVYGEEAFEIVGAAMEVWNTLGYGYLEKVYENALIVELELRGFKVGRQMPLNVFYKKTLVGEYFADIVVNGCILLELKSAEKVANEHIAQTINYLKATGLTKGLLINFGVRSLEYKRFVFSVNP